MTSRSHLFRTLATLALIVAMAGAMDLLAASGANAQVTADNYKTMTRLGGGNRFDPPLKDVAALQKWAAKKRTQAALTAVFEKAGLSSLTPTVIDILTKATPDQVKETDIQPGTTMVWMAFRRGGGKPDIIRNVKWGGKKSFQGFMFIIDDLNQTYTFVVPKPCTNISLLTSEPSREKARLDAEKAARDKAEADRLAAERAAAERARLEAERIAREKAEADRLAREKAEAERLAREKAEADRLAAEKAEAERLAAEKKAKYDVFISGLVGKERRTREVDATLPATGKVNQSLCSALFGLKAGVEMKMSPNFKISPAAGVAFNFEKGSYSSIFAEAEFSYYTLNLKNYIGANVGIWDFAHSNSVTPSIGLQFGTQIWENAALNRIYFVGEGRIFTRQFGRGTSNNYQFWGGIRYVIR